MWPLKKHHSWFYSENNSEAIKNMAYRHLLHLVCFCSLRFRMRHSRLSAGSHSEMVSSAHLWHQTDRKTSTTCLLQKLDLKSLGERLGDRRLKVFCQYHHSCNTAINSVAVLYSTYQLPPLPTLSFYLYCQRLKFSASRQSSPYSTECVALSLSFV